MDILENVAPRIISPRTGTKGPAKPVISMIKSKGGFRSGASATEKEGVCTKRAFSACTLAMTSDTTREMNGGLSNGLKANQTRWQNVAFLSVVNSLLSLPCWVSLTVMAPEIGVGAPSVSLIAMSAYKSLLGRLESAALRSIGRFMLICTLRGELGYYCTLGDILCCHFRVVAG